MSMAPSSSFCFRGCLPSQARGMTLIELLVFIVVVSVGLLGILSVINYVTRSNTDPLVQKQCLAIAEALLEEVEMQPFTYCDPADAQAATATSATKGGTGCSTTVQGLGPANGEQRGSSTNPFNNVPDYATANGGVYTLASPIPDLTGTGASPAGYSATIQLIPEALGPAGAQIASSAPASATDASAMNVLRIRVTVTNGAASVTLEGYRTRYAPTTLP